MPMPIAMNGEPSNVMIRPVIIPAKIFDVSLVFFSIFYDLKVLSECSVDFPTGII